MATQHINFTKSVLAGINPPTKSEGKQGGVFDTYYDTREKGLALLVSNGGAKTFYLYTKVAGRPERIRLGAYTDISIEQARKLAAKCRGEIAEGTNPQASKRAFRQEATLKELFETYMDRYSKPHKKSWIYDEREINKFLAHWFTRKISTIANHEIAKLHHTIKEENGLYQANRMLERIRAMYNKAIEWGWQGSNPAHGIRKFKEKSRDRFLQPDELPYFFAALDQEHNEAIRDYIWLSLLTGARKSNMLAMRWDEISLERKQWRIPETKNGDPVIVALSEQAVNILNTRKAGSTSPWVFPSATSASGHTEEPKKAWQRLLHRVEIYQLITLLAEREDWDDARIIQTKQGAEASISKALVALRSQATQHNIDISQCGLPDIRIHDLRRSLGSWQAVTGASGYVIGKSLGHKSQQATAIYARLNLDPVRASVEKATEAMMVAGGRKSY